MRFFMSPSAVTESCVIIYYNTRWPARPLKTQGVDEEQALSLSAQRQTRQSPPAGGIHNNHNKLSRLKTINKITGKGSKPLLDLFMGSSKGLARARPQILQPGVATVRGIGPLYWQPASPPV